MARRFPAACAILFLLVAVACIAACEKGTSGAADSGDARQAAVFLTSRAGDAMRETGTISLVVPTSGPAGASAGITVYPDRERQVFHGVGGSLTQASAAALGKLSPEKRAEVLAAYFGPDGAGYALSRVHVGSSDFSEYSYEVAKSARCRISLTCIFRTRIHFNPKNSLEPNVPSPPLQWGRAKRGAQDGDKYVKVVYYPTPTLAIKLSVIP